MQNLNVIYEDNHVIVVEKLVNIPSQGTPQWMYEYSAPQEIVQIEEPKTEQIIEQEEPIETKTEDPTIDPEEPNEPEEPENTEEPIKPVEEPEGNQELVQGSNKKSETTVE